MPKVYKSGQSIRDYKITAELNRGMMAIAYAAINKSGRKVFLKQYKSPTVTVEWYKSYLAYQKEVRRRIETSPCQSFCYRFLDAFEAENCFFQAFEFLDKSDSMQGVLDADRMKRSRIGPEPWLLMSKVLMGGMAQLHAAGLVHSDLKPDNVMLIHDPSLGMKYRLRIIDMDFSLLTDRPAPWHGDRGYFGTPSYLSPEHLGGKTPTAASDVFTLGLMLHELLGGQHPYRRLDGGDETAAIMTHKARPVKLRPGLEALLPNAAAVIDTVHRCLAPAPESRPVAGNVLLVLNNRATSEEAPRVIPPVPTPAAVPPPAPPKAIDKLLLAGPDGQTFSTSQGLVVGRVLLKHLGEDSQYVADSQFRLERHDEGWYIEPVPTAPNQTLLNRRHLTVCTRLSAGDEVAVGKESRGIVKLPMKVEFR